MADEIINARVKQKVDTEENWLANPLILLEGEQGFVWDGENDPVNFKIGDGTKTFAELPYFIAYYSNVISHKIIRLPNVSTDQEIAGIFNANTNLYDIVVTNVGGDPVTLNTGTTEDGNEIGSYNIGAGNTVIDLKYMFSSTQTLYLSGFTGNELSIIIIYFNYTESPAIPPSGVEPGAFRFPRNYLGMFYPTGIGQLEACFDMSTGMGVTGTAYENCQICNILNPFLNMEDTYPIGYKTGITLGDLVGGNNVTIAKANLPSYNLELNYNFINRQLGTSGSRFDITTNIPGGDRTAYIPLGGSGTPLDNRPKSRYILYFLAITD